MNVCGGGGAWRGKVSSMEEWKVTRNSPTISLSYSPLFPSWVCTYPLAKKYFFMKPRRRVFAPKGYLAAIKGLLG